MGATDAKDRVQAVRAVVWYAEQMLSGTLRPLSLETPDGQHKAAVEVQFAFPFAEVGGVNYWVSGWFDAVKVAGEPPLEEVFITDYKTTKSPLNDTYWGQYSPNVQVDLYNLVAGKAIPGMPFSGVAIEALQVSGTGVRFGWRQYHASEARNAEFYQELVLWMTMAQQFAQQGFWPRNRTACRFCAFREVCSSEPDIRERLLEAKFERARWNPLTRKVEAVT